MRHNVNDQTKKKTEDISGFLANIEEFPYKIGRVTRAFFYTVTCIYASPKTLIGTIDPEKMFRPNEEVFLGPITLFLLSLLSSFFVIYVISILYADDLLIEASSQWLEMYLNFEFVAISKQLFGIMASIVGFGLLLTILMRLLRQELPPRLAISGGFYLVGAAFAGGSTLALVIGPFFGVFESLSDTTLVYASYIVNGALLLLLARFYILFLSANKVVPIMRLIPALLAAPMLWLTLLPRLGLPVYFNIGAPQTGTQEANDIETLTETLRATEQQNELLRCQIDILRGVSSEHCMNLQIGDASGDGGDVIEVDVDTPHVIYIPDLTDD